MLAQHTEAIGKLKSLIHTASLPMLASRGDLHLKSEFLSALLIIAHSVRQAIFATVITSIPQLHLGGDVS